MGKTGAKQPTEVQFEMFEYYEMGGYMDQCKYYKHLREYHEKRSRVQKEIQEEHQRARWLLPKPIGPDDTWDS